MKVLIVDDEKLIVDDLTFEVESFLSNATVNGTTSAGEALKMAGTTEYDVALLDVDMPEIDGLNLAKQLIAKNPAINIIFVTGYKEYALEAHELYCSAFLVKPVGGRKLRKAFEHLRKPFVDIPEDFFAKHYSGGDLIGKKIELVREQRGISRQHIADLMGVTRQTVFRWERGERLPDVLTFIKLARLLGVEVEDIIEADTESTAE